MAKVSLSGNSPQNGPGDVTRLTHLQRLEAESIQIFREAVSESEKPVMLYSIGKDSSVMLHLAAKAFYPSMPPFPLLHVDTTWKFQAMYEFRDQHGRPRSAWTCSSTRTPSASSGASTRSTTARRCTPTCGRPRASSRRSTSTASTSPSAAPAATRRSRGPRSASSRSARPSTGGTRRRQRPELWRLYNARTQPGESVRVFPLSNWTELDVWQYIHLRADPDRAALLRGAAAGRRARRHADHGRRRPHAASSPARCRDAQSVRFRTLGCYPLTGAIESEADTLTEHHPGDAPDHQLRAPGPGHRPRLQSASMEKKKQEGYF